MRVLRRTVRFAVLSDSAAQHRRVVGFTDDDLRFGTLLLQHPGHALQGAARSEAGDPVVESFAIEVGEDLLRGRSGMDLGIGLVIELAAQEPAVRLGQFGRLGQHPGAPGGRGREHHLCAEEAHDLAALDAEVLGHDHDQGIALGGADHRQTDARVAAGRLDDRLSRLQRAPTLGVLDDPQRQAVLDRAQRVERLDLDVEVDPGRGQSIDAYDRRVPDRIQDALEPVVHESPLPKRKSLPH